jgi:hypothetical protein
VVVGAPQTTDVTELEALGAEVVRTVTPAGVFNAAARRPHARDGMLVIGAPVLVPAGTLERRRRLQQDDARVATVSFWSNAAAQLSFPHWGTPSSHHLGNSLDEHVVSARLRGVPPSSAWCPCTSPPAGRSSSAPRPWRSSATSRSTTGSRSRCIDFALRAQGHGLRNALDPSTYLTRPIDLVDRTTTGPE